MKGYTLIELLVVLVIISIVMTSAVLTVHVNQKKEFETTANQIKQWILLAEEEALLRPAVFSIQVMPNAIQFLNYNENAHRFDVMNETIFKLHRFSKDVQLTLKTNDPLIISSNGDLTPFTLYIGKHNASPTYKMTGEENGNITVDAIQ